MGLQQFDFAEWRLANEFPGVTTCFSLAGSVSFAEVAALFAGQLRIGCAESGAQDLDKTV
jgi:hypothetical protein